jgi:hypothetical protein
MNEAERLRRALLRLKRMLAQSKNPGDKVALDCAIEHIDARLIDIDSQGDWREK